LPQAPSPEIAEAAGVNYRTVANRASVARAHELRKENQSFFHHAVAMAAPANKRQ
jgi:hypothetical protein